MKHKSSNGIRDYIVFGLLLAIVLLQASCTRQRSARNPDPLLGQWVMIADNGDGSAGTVAEYHADGTVVFTVNGTKSTMRYRREPGKVWAERRMAGLGLKDKSGAMDQFAKPGMEMIEFADPDGKFVDYGSTLLTLDPGRRVLYNILTQMWCRPEEEARVKRDLGTK